MGLANGMAVGMHGMGFGLGFLNLIGTILFFVFLVWVFKYAVRGMRHSGRGPWEWRGSGRHGPWGDYGGHGDSRNDYDKAVQTARERLAKNEISPEEFETLKRGLKQEVQESPRAPRSDSALSTARLRFAQGEMSAEEFEAVKNALQS